MKHVKLAILASLLSLAASIGGCRGREHEGANESCAISALRCVSSAQEKYKADTGKFGDYFNLYDGKQNDYLFELVAKADPDHPRHHTKSGYIIDISVNADNSDWWAIATPGTWWTDGERNFKIDSNGVIYWNDTEGDTTNFPKVLGED